jgi:hypothetical protein
VRERELALSFPRRQSRPAAVQREERELAFAHSRRCAFVHEAQIRSAAWQAADRLPSWRRSELGMTNKT